MWRLTQRCTDRYLAAITQAHSFVVWAGPAPDVLFGFADTGYVYTWGEGHDGRLGHDSSLSESEPRVVLALLEYKVADISAGGAHTAVATVDGSLFTWGRGRNGRLGSGTHADLATPFLVRLKHSPQV